MSTTVERISGSSSITRIGAPCIQSNLLYFPLHLFCTLFVAFRVLRRLYGCGKGHVESAPPVRSAIDPYLPTVLLGDPAADKETQAHAREAPVVHVLAPVEAVEHVRQLVGWYPNAIISHVKPVPAVLVPQLYPNFSTIGAVLHGVF